MPHWLKLAELDFPPEQFARLLLDWYGREGRSLPWRNTRDPYPIWLAEIMLQQTTVAAVSDYFQRFIERFPTLQALAEASLEEVVDLWAGLGYYSRARNLHATAIRVATDFAGEFPRSVAELQQLPGIGRSTAGAISALAFEQHAAILDGNVRRVLCRLFALQEAPRSSRAEKQLWAWSEMLTPHERIHDYTQAIMDLGATVCTPRKPSCDQCPVGELCRARQLDLVAVLPLKQASKKIPTRREVVLLVNRNGRYLVRRRPPAGFLGGLWEFPGSYVNEDERLEQRLAWLKAELGLSGAASKLAEVEHVYSHFRLKVIPYLIEADAGSVAEGSCWVELSELAAIALHGAHKKVLATLAES